MIGFLSDFKKFIMRGNVVDLAVGVIIGAAFGGITKSLVDDVMMPPLGLAMGAVDFKEQYIPLAIREEPRQKYEALKAEIDPVNKAKKPTLDQMNAKGIPTLRYGVFLNTIINFLFVAFGVFIIVKAMAKLQKAEPPKPAAPPEPTATEKLLVEIRDTLKAQKAR